MNIAIVSKDAQKLEEHLDLIKSCNFEISQDPEIVVAIGGDGTFLAAEQQYPGVPKVPVRQGSICKKCEWEDLPVALKYLKKKAYKVDEFHKIQATVGKNKLIGLNDIVVRNVDPTHAIRFDLSVNGKQVGKVHIGDGIVVSTGFGSTGYFYSITGQFFDDGLGIAFNNTTIKRKPVMIKEKDVVSLTLVRGRAHVAADNNPDFFEITKGQEVIISQSTDVARVVKKK